MDHSPPNPLSQRADPTTRTEVHLSTIPYEPRYFLQPPPHRRSHTTTSADIAGKFTSAVSASRSTLRRPASSPPLQKSVTYPESHAAFEDSWPTPSAVDVELRKLRASEQVEAMERVSSVREGALVALGKKEEDDDEATEVVQKKLGMNKTTEMGVSKWQAGSQLRKVSPRRRRNGEKGQGLVHQIRGFLGLLSKKEEGKRRGIFQHPAFE